MSLRVLIVLDKFKGTLTASQAAEATARGWRKARPQDRLELLPMSDGGDGFGEVLSGLIGAKSQWVRTVDAAHRACRSQWWWEAGTGTAIVESACVIGLALLPPGKFHPFELDTSGLGRVLLAAARKRCRRLIVGIGGSATNDGGFGLARALGWRFEDRHGHALERWTDLRALNHLRPPVPLPFHGIRLIVAVDVQNRLLGRQGCSRVYGPQKGLHPRDLPLAEACLRRLALVAKRELGTDFARVPGAGAAGGLGFGLVAFAGAEVESGIALFGRRARLSEHLRKSDLVITGEGALDRSTLMGKGVGEIARQCGARGLPCVGLSGVASDQTELLTRFTQVRCLTELTTRAQARRHAALWLARLAQEVAGAWPRGAARPRSGRG